MWVITSMVTTANQNTAEPRPQGALASQYVLGVDLGQARDYTALALVDFATARWVPRWDGTRWHTEPARRENQATWRAVPVGDDNIMFNLRHLERIPLGTSYPDQVAHIGELFGRLPNPDDAALVVDSTGVGRAVLDAMHAADLPAQGLTITGGDSVGFDMNGYRVPKRDLVTNLQMLMGNKQLRVAQSLQEGRTLVNELQNFRYKITLAGNDTFGAWREGEHDDLVLAVAVACWYAMRGVPSLS
jgi:hypothetical protein